MDTIKHTFVWTNGIKMHIAKVGSGPVVLLLHGFPEIWYSWRHQMLALAAAGFCAIAPDHRGYGLTENTDPSKIDIIDHVHDAVGLLDAIGEDKVFVVAKDWGSTVAYSLGFLYPQRIKALVVLGVPFANPACSPKFLEHLPAGHYVRRFMEPGRAEADFGRFDVATVIKRIYILFCNSVIPMASENEQILDLVKPSDPLPEWMKEEDLRVYAELYGKSGLQYPIEVPYKAVARIVEKFDDLKDFNIQAPLLLMLGKHDYICNMEGLEYFIELEQNILPQRKIVYLEEGTHFMQEQFPQQVNQLIVDFLISLRAE